MSLGVGLLGGITAPGTRVAGLRAAYPTAPPGVGIASGYCERPVSHPEPPAGLGKALARQAHMSKLIAAWVAAVVGLGSAPAFAQGAPRADEKKGATMRHEAREAKPKAKRAARKAGKKARQAKPRARVA
jgi:hypothetical protein